MPWQQYLPHKVEVPFMPYRHNPALSCSAVDPSPLYKKLDIDYVRRRSLPVEWLYQVPTDDLSEFTQRRLSIPLTLHRLSTEASTELRQHFS